MKSPLYFHSSHSIHLIRKTLLEIQESCVVVGPQKKLFTNDNFEIAVTYFRAGYSPQDYPSEKVTCPPIDSTDFLSYSASQSIPSTLSLSLPLFFFFNFATLDVQEWESRRMIELSYSIKCPTAAHHLMGTKKVQQILTQPYVVER